MIRLRIVALFFCFAGFSDPVELLAVTEKSPDLLRVSGCADRPGTGKKIVLVSGDEEYRSEEVLPQLAKILALQHGFDCVVLFAINPETQKIDPNFRHNIPGLDHLRDAQAMVIATRFRDLPDSQMEEIDQFLQRGGPVVGMRTATHGFNVPVGKPYAHYGNGYQGERKFWQGGFGRAILGEKWISHHGNHGQESTRGLIADGARQSPIIRGIKDGDIWGPTDVYEVRLPLPGDSQVLVFGQVLSGMKPTDPPTIGEKNNPLMPIAWTKSYRVPGIQSRTGKVFNATMGSSNDFLSEGLRRLIVQGVFWVCGMETSIPMQGLRVDLVPPYDPSDFGFRSDEAWANENLQPADFRKP
tara:strand:+ start:858 stop:1925 length:1068 start_codon:yes stop_codon:yes gene_type:complete